MVEMVRATTESGSDWNRLTGRQNGELGGGLDVADRIGGQTLVDAAVGRHQAEDLQIVAVDDLFHTKPRSTSDWTNDWTACVYLKVLALDDELAVLGPLDGRLRPAGGAAVQLGVVLLVGRQALRRPDEARRRQHVQRGRGVGRVLRVLGAALVGAGVGRRHAVDAQTARTDAPVPAVQVPVPQRRRFHY